MATVVYRGIMFPFQKGSTSFPAESVDSDLIGQALVQLIMTTTGERIMRPDFGSKAPAFVFENNNAVLGNLIRAELQGLIAKYERRVQVVDIQVSREDSSVIITISYIVLSTRRPATVSIPIPLP